MKYKDKKKTCDTKVRLNELDPQVRDEIQKVPGVTRVYSVVKMEEDGDPRMVYEVYLDTREFKKNPNDQRYAVLNSYDVKIIHSVGVVTSIDLNV